MFKTAKIDFGTGMWNDGALDIGVDALYDRSYPYEKQKTYA